MVTASDVGITQHVMQIRTDAFDAEFLAAGGQEIGVGIDEADDLQLVTCQFAHALRLPAARPTDTDDGQSQGARCRRHSRVRSSSMIFATAAS